jgi:hypothetical protein
MNAKLQVMLDFLPKAREKGLDFMTQTQPLCGKAFAMTPAAARVFLDEELEKMSPGKAGTPC